MKTETIKFRTHQEIDDYYRKKGVDVDGLNRESEELGNLLDIAIRRVRSRWSILKRITTRTWIGFAKLHPEIEKEFNRLHDLYDRGKK